MTVQKPRSHWLAILEANDIPCGPINDYAQVLADPQVGAQRMVVEWNIQLSQPQNLGLADQAERDTTRRRAPGSSGGTHRRDIGGSRLREDDIAALRRAGAVQ